MRLPYLLSFILILPLSLSLIFPIPTVSGVDTVEYPSSKDGLPNRFVTSGAFDKTGPRQGNIEILMIPVRFTDQSNSKSPSSISSDQLIPMRNYYSEVSYGNIGIREVHITSWLMMPRAMSWYGLDLSSTTRDIRWPTLIRDALKAADPSVNFNDFEHVMIVHAGSDQSSSGNSNDLWSKATIGKATWLTSDGLARIGVAIVSEENTWEVFAHEFGHNLGLRDLYDFGSPKQEFVGPWSLMANHRFGSHLTSVEKEKLGWLDGRVLTIGSGQKVNVTLHKLETLGSIMAIKIPKGPTYNVIEYRRQELSDSRLPSAGIVTYLVDESKDGGRGPIKVVNPVKRVALVPGDRFVDRINQIAVKVHSLNSDTTIIQVQKGFAALRISPVTVEGPLIEDAVVVFSFSVENLGLVSSDWMQVSIETGTSSSPGIWVPPINPGQRVDLEVRWEAVRGAQLVRVVVDIGDAVPELNKQDNIVRETFFIQPETILIDRVEISNGRVDVGSIQEITFHATRKLQGVDAVGVKLLINGQSYLTDSEGMITIDVRSIAVGSRSWTTTGVEYKNGDRAFDQTVPDPTIIWDRINVDLDTKDSRIDVGSNATISWSGIYAYDKKPFLGSLRLSEPTTHDNVGKYEYTTNSIVDNLYGLTAFKSNTVEVIFDQVFFELIAENQRIEVGTAAIISPVGVYAYDQTQFLGSVNLNDVMIKHSLGKVIYFVIGIDDDRYGLTQFQTNEIEIVFDRIMVVHHVRNPTLGSITVQVELIFELNNDPVEDATTIINGDLSKSTRAGIYESPFTNWLPFVSYEIQIQQDGFNPILVSSLALLPINLILYIAIGVGTGVVSFLFMQNRSKSSKSAANLLAQPRQVVKTKFCRQCGVAMQPSAGFCRKCGKKTR